MIHFNRKQRKSALSKNRGASLTGYGLIVGLIAILAIAAVGNVGEQIRRLFNAVDLQLDTVSAGAGATAPASAITGMTGPVAQNYGAGDTLSFTIMFDGSVTVTGTPSISLQIGANTRSATLASGGGTSSLTFTYTVLASDSDPDGIAFSSTSVSGDIGTAPADFSSVAPDLSGVTVFSSDTFLFTYGGSSTDLGYGILLSSGGSLVVSGFTQSEGDTDYDAFIAEFAADGSGGSSFATALDDGASGKDRIQAGSIELSNGKFMSAGWLGEEAALMLFNADGSFDTAKTITGTGSRIDAIVKASGSGVYVGGFTTGNNDGFISLVSEDLSTVLWTREINPAGFGDQVTALVATSDGGVGYAAQISSVLTNFEIGKFDSSGTEVFREQYNSSGGLDRGSAIAETASGGLVVFGAIEPTGSDRDMAILEVDSAGANPSLYYINTSGADILRSVEPYPGGGYVVSGAGPSYGGGFIARLDASYGTIWATKVGDSNATISDVVVMPDGGVAFAGSSGSPWNVLVGRLDVNGEITAGGCTNDSDITGSINFATHAVSTVASPTGSVSTASYSLTTASSPSDSTVTGSSKTDICP